MSPLRFAWRVLVIAAVMWLCAVRYVVGRIGTLFVRGKDERRAAVARLRGRLLREAMERLGATFIKLGQVMSTRPDLFEPELIDELRSLLTRDIDAFARSFRGKKAAEIEAKDLINRALAIGRKHGLRPVTEMTLIMVAIVTCEGVGKQLDPTSDSLAKIAEYLTPILVRRGMLPS